LPHFYTTVISLSILQLIFSRTRTIQPQVLIIYFIYTNDQSWDRSVYSQIYPGVEKGKTRSKFIVNITGHDRHRIRIVREVLSDLVKACGVDPENIIKIWEGKDKVGKAIINGPVGMC
jgi:hypothetical protein